MEQENHIIESKTIALIDSLRTTCGEYGLAGGGSEYKIITEMFLYKFFNDKFGYEAKRNQSMANVFRMQRNGMPNMTLLTRTKLKTSSAISPVPCPK